MFRISGDINASRLIDISQVPPTHSMKSDGEADLIDTETSNLSVTVARLLHWNESNLKNWVNQFWHLGT